MPTLRLRKHKIHCTIQAIERKIIDAAIATALHELNCCVCACGCMRVERAMSKKFGQRNATNAMPSKK